MVLRGGRNVPMLFKGAYVHNKQWALAYGSFFLICLFLGGTCLTDTAWADSRKEVKRRLMVGLRFFPNVIAVDEDIARKRNQNGNYTLLFVYNRDKHHAEKLVTQLQKKLSTIKKIPVEVSVVSMPRKEDQAAGIFLCEWLPDHSFKQIMGFAESQNIIVFSPFVGDVERGATAGLNISTKIRPSLNLSTLKRSSIRLNNVFFRLSKHYE